MAVLTITELKSLGRDAHGNDLMAPQVPAEVEVALGIGGSAAPSDPFGNTTRCIMLNCDTACCLAFGEDPVAETGKHRMGANETRFYTVTPGQRLSVIASS